MDPRGLTIVMTGASSGTGKAAARRFHAAGAHVLPVGGSPEKSSRMAAELDVPCLSVDLGSITDVRRLAGEIREMTGRIDVLALNAGAIMRNGSRTVDGLEANLQVNALGHWVLMTALADLVAGGRIVATSSETHIGAHVDLGGLNDASGLGWHGAYARAKLVQGILLREFGRRSPGTVVADFHPGAIASDIGRHLGRLGSVASFLAKPLLGTTEDGADRMIHLCLADEDIDGGYFEKDRRAPGSAELYDGALAKRLWTWASETIGGIHDS